MPHGKVGHSCNISGDGPKAKTKRIGDLEIRDDEELGFSIFIEGTQSESKVWFNAKGTIALYKWLKEKIDSET